MQSTSASPAARIQPSCVSTSTSLSSGSSASRSMARRNSACSSGVVTRPLPGSRRPHRARAPRRSRPAARPSACRRGDGWRSHSRRRRIVPSAVIGSARSPSTTRTRGSSTNAPGALEHRRRRVDRDRFHHTRSGVEHECGEPAVATPEVEHTRRSVREELHECRFTGEPGREPAHPTDVLVDLRRVAPRHAESLLLRGGRRRVGARRATISGRARRGRPTTSPRSRRSRATPPRARRPRRSGRDRRHAGRLGPTARARRR